MTKKIVKDLEARAIDMHQREIVMEKETEMGAVFRNLDDDSANEEKLSNIDFNTRLTPGQISASVRFDELKTLGILPSEANLTRLKKRLSVSLNGLGREEKVRIVQGERENRTGGGVMERLGSLFKPREK